MSKKLDQHDLVSSLTQIALELGRTPTVDEFLSKSEVSKADIRRVFSSYAVLVRAAGLDEPIDKICEVSQDKAYKRICSRKEKLESFTINDIDINALFEKAGNPCSLKVSCQPDTHVKHRDRAAVSSYLKFLDWYKPHVHIIMGDFVDCEGISHWPADTLQPRRLVPELMEGQALLKQIVEATPGCSTRIFLEGNHERWIEQAKAQLPEFFEGIEQLGFDLTIKGLLALEKFGYEFFPLNEFVRIGKANFTHGLYTSNTHAKEHLSRLKVNIYYGHLHDDQSHTDTSLDGTLESASLACLCRLDARFLKGKPNNWKHGHGAFEFFRDGTYVRYQVQIKNGVSSFAGQVFDGNGD